jgi:signal transduction histidine kinase
MGRTLAVLLLGFLVVGAIMVGQMYVERQTMLSDIGGWHVVSRIAEITKTLNDTEPHQRQDTLRTYQGPVFSVTHSPQSEISVANLDWKGRLVKDALQSQLGAIDDDGFRIGQAAFDTRQRSQFYRGDMMAGMHGREAFQHRSLMVISLRLNDGSWLNFATPPAPIKAVWNSRFFWPGALVVLAVVGICVWAVRLATQPLSLFAQAAERLGLDFNAKRLDETGPLEVRRAAKAFNLMQHRLQAFIKDRTHMLAAISHDLRTPITRLKLRAEFIEDDEQRSKMLNDLDEMEAMISATLQFARDDAANEPTQDLDLAQLLRDLIENSDIECQLPQTLPFVGRPVGLKRLIGNLLGNAQRFGTRVEVELTQVEQNAVLTVTDDGPGIPADMLERVFDPFVRVEGSRSRDTGGTGLGLAAVKMITQAHGGTVELSNLESGGLQARVVLPLI